MRTSFLSSFLKSKHVGYGRSPAVTSCRLSYYYRICGGFRLLHLWVAEFIMMPPWDQLTHKKRHTWRNKKQLFFCSRVFLGNKRCDSSNNPKEQKVDKNLEKQPFFWHVASGYFRNVVTFFSRPFFHRTWVFYLKPQEFGEPISGGIAHKKNHRKGSSTDSETSVVLAIDLLVGSRCMGCFFTWIVSSSCCELVKQGSSSRWFGWVASHSWRWQGIKKAHRKKDPLLWIPIV